MPTSTAKRESLIPRIHLLSIALLLIVAFIVLMPSRDIFTYSTGKDEFKGSVDKLDLAYLKARDASGDLSKEEVRSVIRSMIRSARWEEARILMAQQPDVKIDQRDQFLLDLETASAGFFNAGNEARSVSYKANLIALMNDLYDTPTLHDEDTLGRAAEMSADLGQPTLSARYFKLIANNYPEKGSESFEQCARILKRFGMSGESVECYESAIASTNDPKRASYLTYKLGSAQLGFGERLAASATLDRLMRNVPNDRTSIEQAASFALQSEKPELAHPLYERMAGIEQDRAVYWLEKATKWALASNQPGMAAEYVLTIRDLSDDEHKAELNQRRQELLIAAGRNDEAMAAMHERIAANPNSGEELEEGIQLARSVGYSQQAGEWNEQLLAIRPFDIAAMRLQVEFSLANQRLKEALDWSKKVLEQEPYEIAHRIRVAQLEEWNGNVDNAMQQRQWIAEHKPGLENDRELIRLAELNWDSKIAADALLRISSYKSLTTEEVQKLVKLYEQDGSPQLAAKALEGMMDGKNDAMLLRELASLHAYHSNYNEALAAWDQFASRFGRSAEESLNRMELLWRLKRPTEALAAADKMSSIDNHRIIQGLIDSDQHAQAIKTAENMWRESGDVSLMLSAIHLALKEKIYPHYERYLDANEDLLELRELPEYWLTVADHYNQIQDTQAAIETYRSTLKMQPNNVDAMTGLIWTLLGENTNNDDLLAALTEFEQKATELPKLWNPYAIGYLKVGEAKKSLRWFSKLMARDDHDYNVLLSFADALQQSGNSGHAYKVRQYAVQQLTPQLMAQASDKVNHLSRDYIGLLRSYGGVAENEAFTQRLLNDLESATPEEDVWRRELAASWYLATQRHDYARLVMTKLHERRLETPLWQRLSLAMHENNLAEVKEILASARGTISTGDEIAALRKLGLERKAYVLAKNTAMDSTTASERKIAQGHMLSIRGSRPGYYAGLVNQRKLGELDITETGLSLRQTLSAADLGFELDYKRNKLSSTTYNTLEDDIAVSAHFGNSRRGGSLTAGIHSDGANDLGYTGGEYYIRHSEGKHELSSEVAFNEVPDSSVQFRIGAKQDMAELRYKASMGKREFVRVTGNVSELKTRDTSERISRGVGASIELGSTGTIGSNSWTMGVVASGNNNERTAQPLSSFVLDNSSQLAISASLFRGGIRSTYPQAASPRYKLSARFGQSWPSNSSALELEAGAGFRVLGNDELSVKFEHDRFGNNFLDDASNSSVGIQYTNHF